MKSNKEILDEFGEKIIQDSFDPIISNILSLRQKENPLPIFKNYCDLLQNLNEKDFTILQEYLKDRISSSIYNFLRFFEENENFKIIYQENEKQINLLEISEMLKAEPIIENGWIERFSKHVTEDK
ncbi:hypothetical protein [Tenacibaculum amylolyticum]|uniref:hypothetical protein n=1 Tax=Tenacibaculum amylolyticum TaxID=104269 RepID=UPI003895B155